MQKLEFKKKMVNSKNGKVVLQLFVCGQSSKTISLTTNFINFCRSFPKEAMEYKVHDILMDPEAAKSAGIIATPTIVKTQPAPQKMSFGPIANEDQLLERLGL